MGYHAYSRKTFMAAAVIPQDTLVKLTAMGANVCGAGDLPLGVTEVGARELGEPVGVRLINSQGTLEVLAGATITVGQLLTSGADGTVVPHTGTGPVVGMAMEVATSGGIVVMMPLFTHIPATPGA